MNRHQTSIVSIDVGGIFLMDILINESDPFSSAPTSAASSYDSSLSANHQYQFNNQNNNKVNSHHLDTNQNYDYNNHHSSNYNASNSDKFNRPSEALAHGYLDGAAGVYFNSRYAQRDLEDAKLSYYYHPYRSGYTERDTIQKISNYSNFSNNNNNNNNQYHQENKMMTFDHEQSSRLFKRQSEYQNFLDDEEEEDDDQQTSSMYWQPEYLGSSLDRLASVINNCDEQYQYGDGRRTKFFKSSSNRQRNQQNNNNNKSYNYDFEDFDEGFAAGSGSDASCSSASSSFSACSEDDDEDECC